MTEDDNRPRTVEHAVLRSQQGMIDGKAGAASAAQVPYTGAHMNATQVNRVLEERLKRRIDILSKNADINADQRLIAIARTNFEIAWMALNRAIVKQAPVAMPEDPVNPLDTIPPAA